MALAAISHCRIGTLSLVENNLSSRRAVVSLDLEVFATIGRLDPDSEALTSIYVQPQIAIARPGDEEIDTDNVIIDGLRITLGLGLSRAPSNGSAKISGVTVAVTGAPLHSFGADQDTYRDLRANGTFLYLATAVGAPEPLPTPSALRIGRTRTDGAGVVEDALIPSTLRNFGDPFRVLGAPDGYAAYLGGWDVAATYATGAVVFWAGSYWKALAAVVAGVEPGTAPASWALFQPAP